MIAYDRYDPCICGDRWKKSSDCWDNMDTISAAVATTITEIDVCSISAIVATHRRLLRSCGNHSSVIVAIAAILAMANLPECTASNTHCKMGQTLWHTLWKKNSSTTAYMTGYITRINTWTSIAGQQMARSSTCLHAKTVTIRSLNIGTHCVLDLC